MLILCYVAGYIFRDDILQALTENYRKLLSHSAVYSGIFEILIQFWVDKLV